MTTSRNPTPFIALVGNTPTMRIVDFLISNAPYNFNKTQLSERIGISKKTLYNAWTILEEFNIVKTISSDGRSRFYVLNKEAPVTRTLIKLHASTTIHVLGDIND